MPRRKHVTPERCIVVDSENHPVEVEAVRSPATEVAPADAPADTETVASPVPTPPSSSLSVSPPVIAPVVAPVEISADVPVVAPIAESAIPVEASPVTPVTSVTSAEVAKAETPAGTTELSLLQRIYNWLMT
jgi:hypothetical protein